MDRGEVLRKEKECANIKMLLGVISRINPKSFLLV